MFAGNDIDCRSA